MIKITRSKHPAFTRGSCVSHSLILGDAAQAVWQCQLIQSLQMVRKAVQNMMQDNDKAAVMVNGQGTGVCNCSTR